MSLMDCFKAPCVRLIAKSEPDGEGGRKTVWEEGELFTAAIVLVSAASERRAEKDNAVSEYTVAVDPALSFVFHDVFRRKTDGKIFRAITDSDDKVTPICASFRFAQFKAEEWRLPT